MASFKENLDDIKYIISKDYSGSKSTQNTYRMLVGIWVLSIILTIIVPVIWFVPTFKGIATILKIIITATYAISLIGGIALYFACAKE